MVIGDTQLHLDRRSFYEKELRLVVSRSYGPGRYDRAYEEKGVDYPYEYVRWTLQRNMEAFLALAPQLRLQPLVSHRFDIASANQAYELLHSQHSQTCLGILLRYPEPRTPTTASISLVGSKTPACGPVPRVGVSVIGAGTIGASWAAYFLARGFSVGAYDPAPNGEAFARRFIDIGDDVGDERAEETLAGAHGHARRIPCSVEIVGQASEVGRRGSRIRRSHRPQPGLAGLDAMERRLPALLELCGD